MLDDVAFHQILTFKMALEDELVALRLMHQEIIGPVVIKPILPH